MDDIIKGLRDKGDLLCARTLEINRGRSCVKGASRIDPVGVGGGRAVDVEGACFKPCFVRTAGCFLMELRPAVVRPRSEMKISRACAEPDPEISHGCDVVDVGVEMGTAYY